MKPYVICHMMSSVDGSLSPSRYTTSADGTRKDWTALYDEWQQDLELDAWIVGRVTMAEMSKGEPHAVDHGPAPERPIHKAKTDRTMLGIALDPSGRLHFRSPVIEDAQAVVLLGADVPDSHLRELMADGVSYVVSDRTDVDVPAMLEVLSREFGVRRLALEGGAGINGSFLAAGVVDELSVLVAPAIEGRAGAQRIIEFGDEGLQGKVALTLRSAEVLRAGVVHLRYRVGAPA